MAEKTILRSATVDKHGDYIGLEQLQDYVDAVNGEHKLRYLANHRRDLPPLGYLDHAEINQVGLIHHAVAEPITFVNRRVAEWDADLIIEDSGMPTAFVGRNKESTQISITVDKNNFKSFESFERTGASLKGVFNGDVKLDASMRKSYLPDPQLVITIAGYYTIFKPLVDPLMSKIGEKIAEGIGEDVYGLSKNLLCKIADTVRITRNNMVPKNKVLLTIFEIPGNPYIELQIKTDRANEVVNSITEKKLAKIYEKVQDLKCKIDISEIYFVYNTKQKWEFTYLISKTGEVIGTKSSFAKRDKLVNRINLSATKAFSVGATGVKYDYRPTSRIAGQQKP